MVYKIPDGGINVKMNDYVSVLNKASNYTEINELYPCIENVVIDIDEININIVSTDRNTIYRYFVPNQDKVEKVFIPVSNASSLLLDKHINKSLDTLSIKVDDTRTYFSTPDMDMYEIHLTVIILTGGSWTSILSKQVPMSLIRIYSSMPSRIISR